MVNSICLDKNYSTTKMLTREKPKPINKPEDKFETLLFLHEGESRKGEGGLRTKGYFKKSYDDKPLISIVTVVFNGEKHLEQTIESVINQTYDNVEYIIIDGGSCDDTLDIIKKHEDQIDYWVSEKDNGIYDAMNKGIKVAMGEFIAFINADDWYEKNAIEYVIKIYNQKKNIDFFYGNLNFIKENGEVVLWQGNRGEAGLAIPHPTCFVRSSILKQGLFNTDFKIAADTELTLRLFNSNIESLYINKVIANFRDGGVSSEFWATQKETFRILTKYIGLWYAVKNFLKKSIITIVKFIKRIKN